MTTTIEITKKLERLAIQLQDGENALLKLAAQRLRELDKPDCVWTQKEAFAGWKYYHPSCILMADSGALPTKKNRYCQYCGSAVKEGK